MLAVSLPIQDELGDFFAYGFQENSLGRLITNSIDIILIFAIILSLLFIFMGGISWVTSGGNKDQLETARGRIIHAILGLIIAISAYALWVLVVKNFLGIDIVTGVQITKP